MEKNERKIITYELMPLIASMKGPNSDINIDEVLNISAKT